MLSKGTPYHKLYYSIANLSPKIRVITILDYDGRLIFEGHKKRVKRHLMPIDQSKSFQATAEMWHIRNQYADFIGKGKYAMAEYEKIKRYTIPLDDTHLLYITTEPDLDHCSFLDSIFRLLDYHKTTQL